MPTPNFMPVIARDIPGAIEQQYRWAAFNAPIDSNNAASLARANEQANQYRWMSGQVEAQQASAADERQRADAAQKENIALQMYQWNRQQTSAEMNAKQGLELEKSKIEASNKILEARQKAQDEAAKLEGISLASQYQRLKSTVDFSQKQLDDATSEIDQLTSRLNDKKNPLNPVELSHLSRLKALISILPKTIQKAESEFSAFKPVVWGKGYQLAEDGIIDNKTGKVFKFDLEVKASATPAAQNTFMPQSSGNLSVGGINLPVQGGSPAPGWMPPGRSPEKNAFFNPATRRIERAPTSYEAGSLY